MKPITGVIAVALLATSLGACASETYYSRPAPGYAYAPGYSYTTTAPAPGYYAPAYAPPRTYQTTTYTYTQQPTYQYSSPRRSYDGYWDYQRNYRGIHSSPEFSSM